MFEPPSSSAWTCATPRGVIRQRGSITEEEIKNLQGSQKLNFLEAAVTENATGFGDNALAGRPRGHPPRTITSTGNHGLVFDVSPRWTSLFESWHLAFVTAT